MSYIVIRCDGCGREKKLNVRQAHQARDILQSQGWRSKSEGGGNRWGRQGSRKDDFCPDC